MSAENVRSSRRKRASARPLNIDHVDVDESFAFTGEKGDPVGDGCYITTTINNKRYYGVLISQDSLREASDLHFKDEAASLALNSRMVNLPKKEALQNQAIPGGEESDRQYKYSEEKQVQKFKYVDANATTLGYRVILATYANVLEAARDDDSLFQRIKSACDKGGDWVGTYYYQYETERNSLKPTETPSRKNAGLLHTSMSFNSFLFNTSLPPWYPLKNSTASRAKILNMLNLKTDKHGGTVKYNASAAAPQNGAVITTNRDSFRVGIVGAGLAGLGCAQELLRLSKKKNISLDVVLYEARNRVGGRCFTEYTTFKTPSGKNFPIELGAGWIHGTTGNPLAILAQAAGTKMRGASESVKLLIGQMKEADSKMDTRISDVFDKVLDQGAEKCWGKDESDVTDRRQKTTRFYASLLGGSGIDVRKQHREQYQKDVASYRYSSDVSVQIATKEALTRHCAGFSPEEMHLLNWNIKHAEYSFGANIEDLSMKYWDADDDYAFKGKHVLLEEGYSTIASAILTKCRESGDSFKLHLDHSVEKIEYDLKCYSRADQDGPNTSIGVSDTCRITGGAAKSSQTCDFTVVALPLGVLKSSVKESSNRPNVVFKPPLPATKVDSIEHVGFGILNKIYIQFPFSFWRKRSSKEDLKGSAYLSDAENNFGNASAVNPQHYMFFDVGFDPERNSAEDPHILHTLISGLDAIRGENLSDKSIVEEVMTTLRHLFSDISIPQPITYKVSRWGGDDFSQGAYSFLPPGSSDQDYFSLQSSVCSDGDIFSVGESRTMRLFFAGEHTSAHYPSLAHGAYISGVRAARDILFNIEGNKGKSSGGDSVVPMTRYRMKNPNAPLKCQLCGLPASDKEGELKAFQRDRRLVLVHRNCAEFSPDVYIKNGVWYNVIKCINRGKQLRCVRCKKNGATIGCNEASCKENYHFGCCDSSWKFEEDGKSYLCALHRQNKAPVKAPVVDVDTQRSQNLQPNQSKNGIASHVQFAFNAAKMEQGNVGGSDSKTRLTTGGYTSLPILAYRFKHPTAPIKCALCNTEKVTGITGKMLYLSRDREEALVHENCIKFSNLMCTTTPDSPTFINVVETIEAARTCFKCHTDGATIRCNQSGCFRHYHLGCSEWDKIAKFHCLIHRHQTSIDIKTTSQRTKVVLVESKSVKVGKRILSHDLFYYGAQQHDSIRTLTKVKKRTREYAPSNEFEPRLKKTCITNRNHHSFEDEAQSNRDREKINGNGARLIVSSEHKGLTSLNASVIVAKEAVDQNDGNGARLIISQQGTNKSSASLNASDIVAKEVENQNDGNQEQVNENGARLIISQQDNNKGSTPATTSNTVPRNEVEARNNEEQVNENGARMIISQQDNNADSTPATTSNTVTRKELEARDNRNQEQVNENGAELIISQQDNNKGSISVTTSGDITKNAQNDCNQETVNENVVDLTLSPKDEGSTSLNSPVIVTKEAEAQNSRDKEKVNEIVIDLTILSPKDKVTTSLDAFDSVAREVADV